MKRGRKKIDYRINKENTKIICLFTHTKKVTNELKSHVTCLGFPGGSAVENLLAMQKTQERWVRSPGREDPVEKGMATHSSILAWRMPWSEESDRLQSMGSQSRTWLKWLSMHARTSLIWLEHGTAMLLPAKYCDTGCRLGLRASCTAESSAFLCFLSFLAR